MNLGLCVRRGFCTFGLLVFVAVTVAACGGGSSSSVEPEPASESGEASTEAAGAEGGGNSAKVAEILQAAEAPGTWKGPTEPAPAAKGKFIVYIPTLAAAEGEQITLEGVESAAKALGWKMKMIDGEGTPQGYNKAIDAAITEGAEGVFLGGIEPSVIPNGLKALEQAGIPVVGKSSTEHPSNKNWLGSAGYREQEEAEALAAFVTKESGGKAKIMVLEDSEFGTPRERAKYFKQALPDLCPECEIVNETEMQVTELETKLAPKIAGVIQANPETEYIYGPYDATSPPTVQGLKQVQATDVKLINYGGFKQSTEYLRNKEWQTGDIANATHWQAWEALDTLNRYFDGLPIEQKGLNSEPIKLLTWENISSVPPGEYYEGEYPFEEKYEKLWGVE